MISIFSHITPKPLYYYSHNDHMVSTICLQFDLSYETTAFDADDNIIFQIYTNNRRDALKQHQQICNMIDKAGETQNDTPRI